MTDCANVEMRDLLPDFVHDRLGAADATRVQLHLSECAYCSAEVELIRAVMASVPAAPAIDVASIIANLPQPPARVDSVARPAISRGGRVFRFGVRQLPLAAGLALAASLTFVVVGRQKSPTEIRPAASAQAPTVVPAPSAPAEKTSVPASKVVATASRPAQVASLTLGGSTEELSDESLEILVDEIERMDAVPGTEPESLEPSIDDEEGSR
jgi:anti-sigma factor RsiW